MTELSPTASVDPACGMVVVRMHGPVGAKGCGGGYCRPGTPRAHIRILV